MIATCFRSGDKTLFTLKPKYNECFPPQMSWILTNAKVESMTVTLKRLVITQWVHTVAPANMASLGMAKHLAKKRVCEIFKNYYYY